MCMQISRATSALPPSTSQQHAHRAVVMRVTAASGVDAHDALDLEDLADAVEQIVQLHFQRLAGLAGRRLREQIVGRRGARALGQLRDQIVGQLDEFLVVRDRSAFAAQIDHRADFAGDIGKNADPPGGRRAAGAFFGDFRAGFAKLDDRQFHVAARLPSAPSCNPSSANRFSRAGPSRRPR